MTGKISQSDYLTIFNSAHEGLVVHDITNGTIIECNQKAADIWGYSIAEMQQMTVGQLSGNAPPFDQAHALQMVQEAARRGQKRFEWLAKNKSGREFWVDVNLNKIKLESQEYILAIVNDITERKLAEKELQDKETRFRTLFESSADAIYLMAGSTFIECNAGAVKMFGCTDKSQMVSHTPVEFSPTLQPDGRPSQDKATEYINAALGGQPQRFYWQHCRRDKTIFDAEVSLNSLKLGDKLYLQATVRDITERKLAEESLKISEQAYRTLAENLPGIVYRVFLRENNRMHFFNKTLVKITGYTAEELKSGEICSIDPLILPEDRPMIIKKVKNAIQEKRPFSLEYRLKHKNGTIVSLQENGMPIDGPDGKPIYIDGVIYDTTERKRIEEASKASELRYRRLFEAAKDGILILDHETGMIVDVNPFLETLLGYTAKEMLGRQLWEIGIFKDIAASKEAYANLQANDYIRYEDLPLETKSGKKAEVEFISNVYLVGSQKVIQCNIRDITERKQAELLIKKSEERYRRIIKTASEGIWELDRDFRTVAANDKMCKMLGYPLAELLGRPISELMPPEEHADNSQRIAARQRGLDETYERKFIRKDGQPLWTLISASPILDENNRMIGAFGMITDITERKQAEQALKENEEKYRTLVEQQLEGIIVAQGITPRLVFVNQAMANMFGYSREELLFLQPEGLINLIHPASRDMFFNHYRERVSGKSVEQSYDFHAVKKDGSDIRIRTYSTRIIYQGEPAVQAAFIDVTKERLADEAIRQLNANLEQRVKERTAQLEIANKELESFSYSVSHDLRAPLRGIDGFSKILVEDYAPKLDDQAKDYIERIHKATVVMSQLIDDLLRLSQISMAKVNQVDLNLSDLAKEVADCLRTENPQRKVEVIITPGLMAHGDRGLLWIVLENLLGNAYKFTSTKENARIEFGKTAKDGKELFFVRDNGAGFDMNYTNKLFIPFQRLHSANEFPGTGIGLATVKRIVSRHGGSVLAEGKVGAGATFYFSIGGDDYGK